MAPDSPELRPSVADITAYFNRLIELGANRLRVHQALAIQFRSWVMRNFEGEGALRGGWAPLKPSTIEQRARKGYWPGKILQRSGWLKQSFKEFFDNDQAGVGTELDYSKYHEDGYSIFGHPVPARPMLPTAELIRGDVFRVYQFWLTKLEQAAKL